MNRQRTFQTLAAAATVGFFAVQALAQIERPEPYNQVVILVDASISYRERRQEAVARASALLEDLARTKVHRGDEAIDQITIASLDAVPEAIWQGTLRDLKKMTPKDWIERFAARKDYDGCTDVGAAFRLAAKRLDGDPRYVNKFVFAFSDLVDEPPMSSIRKCRPAAHPSLPPADMPWEALSGVRVAVFWAPPNQKLAWTRAADQHGLGESFQVYTTSESAAVRIEPLPRKAAELTEEEKAAAVRTLGTLAWAGGALLVGLAILFGGLVAAATIVSRRRARRGETGERPSRASKSAAPVRR